MAELRRPTRLRRVSRLERIDESDGFASGTRDPLWSPASTSRQWFSPDEEAENCHRQVPRSDTKSTKGTSQRETGELISQRMSTRSRIRQPLQNVPEQTSRTVRAACDPSGRMLSTLNEKKQKKFIALFYWNRRTLETYFLAWKWVVFDLVQYGTRHQQREFKLLRPYAPAPIRPVSAASSIPRRRSLLLRNTLQQQRSDSVISSGHQPNYRDRMSSLRNEYRLLKATALQQQHHELETRTSEPMQPEDDTIAKRKAYKEQLRVFYHCFETWRLYLKDCRVKTQRQQVLASEHFRKRQLRRHFHPWARTFLSLRRFEYQQWCRICEVGDERAKRRWFRLWRHWHKCKQSEKQRVLEMTQLRVAFAVARWQKWTKRTTRLCQASLRRRRIVLRRYLMRLNNYRFYRRDQHLLNKKVIALAGRYAIRRMWNQWHRNVHEDESTTRVRAIARQLSHKTAVTKWKRFVAIRRELRVLAEQADCCLYEGILRRFWSRWISFFYIRIKKQRAYEQAVNHWISQRERQVIHTLLLNHRMCEYAHGKIRDAKEHHRVRLARVVLCAWLAHVQVAKRSQQFQCARLKRLLVLLFTTWRQYANTTRRLGEVQHSLVAYNQAIRLKHSFRMWRYRYKLSATYWLVDSRYALRRLETCMRMWQDVTKRRCQWNSIIGRFSARRSLSLERYAFSAMQRYAVSVRCRRRLVRLFQKKLLGKKLQECVQTMHNHAKLERFYRAIRARLLESAWHSWLTFTSDQQRQAEARITAVQFFSSRRCSLAIDLWKRNTQLWYYTRQCNSKAITHLINRTMRQALHAWYLASRVRVRRRELVEMHATKRQHSKLHKYLMQWNRTAQIIRRQRQEIYRLWYRAMSRRCELVFYAWSRFTSHRRARRGFLEEVQHRVAYHRVRALLRAWQNVACHQKVCRVAFEVVFSRRRSRLLQRVVYAWRIIAVRWHRKRLDNLRAASFHREFLLLWMFYGWQHSTLERLVMREKQHRAQAAIAQILSKRALKTWKRKLTLRQERNASLCRATAFYLKRQRRIGVEAWHAFITRRRERQIASTLALTLAATVLKRRIFRSWVKFTSGTRAFKSKLRVIFQTGDGDILRRTFRCWRRYKCKETLDRRAELWRWRWLIRTTWRNWRHQTTFARKMRKNVLITNRLLQSNALRSRFSQWRHFIAVHHLKVNTLERADAHHVAQCYRTAIKRLRLVVRDAQAIEVSLAFHLKHLQHQQFKNWSRGVLMQKNRREQKALATKRAVLARVGKAFSGWKRLVRARQALLHEKADHYVNMIALKRTWKAWNCFVRYGHLNIQARTWCVRRHTLASFRQWIQFACEQQQIRLHVEAAVAHLDRVTMQKMWGSWIEFVADRREYHHLSRVALSFYSTRIVQHRCFQAWLIYVSSQHERQTRQLKADAFCVMLSLRRYLNRWESYVTHRQDHKQAKQDEDAAILQLIRSRAVRKWRARALILRSLAQAKVRATKFFIQRAETKVVQHLLCHAAIKKTTRKCHVQAVSHRTLQLTLTFFSRWTRFLAWRKRHHHLLRLFRTNQLGDYFSLWHKYVTRSQHKRVLQTTAIQGYHRLVLRSVFRRWRGRCHHWCNKRLANCWHNERLGHFVLGVWAHKVRVLRRMRHMFQFQDSFRLKTHFQAWKRNWWRKKQQVVRVHGAGIWYNKQRLVKCFALWIRWLDIKHKEKATVQMAIGFRVRYFSRKYLHVWHSVVRWKRRKVFLLAEAERTYRHKQYRSVIKKLIANAKVHKRINNATLEANKMLTNRKVQRSVFMWKQFTLERQALRALSRKAAKHEDDAVVRRTWNQFRQWYSVRCVKCAKLQRARHHSNQSISRRTFKAWLLRAKTQRSLRTGLKKFKDKYFRGVVDDCFLRWTSFVSLKRKLRALKLNVELSHERQTFEAWRVITQDAQRRNTLVAAMTARRSRALLHRCMLHWESVATERWMYARLVYVACMQRNRRQKGLMFQQWKSLLPVRRARQTCRMMARKRNDELLVGVLQAWRFYVEQMMHGSDSEDSSAD